MSDDNESSRITDEERARRQHQVNFARGSVRLEGFILGQKVEALNRRFLEGELSSDQHVAEVRRLYDPTFQD